MTGPGRVQGAVEAIGRADSAVRAAAAEVERLQAALAAVLDRATPEADPCAVVVAALAATPHRHLNGKPATAATRDAWAARNAVAALAAAGWLLPLPPRPADESDDGAVVAGILSAVAAEFGVTVAALTGADRRRPVTAARQAAMYLCRDAGMTYPRIGAVFGRDHATVMYGVNRAARAIEQDSAFGVRLDGCRPRPRPIPHTLAQGEA